ncbi:MAG: hypothetical protein ABL888_21920 [Pirellulaceae bacterium]
MPPFDNLNVAGSSLVRGGERLISDDDLATSVSDKHEEGQGPNLTNLLDDPPAEWNWERIVAEGIDVKYLEVEQGKQVFNLNSAVFEVLTMFNGPFGFPISSRFN